MSRSQTQLPADLAQRYPVLIVANALETDDNILVRSVQPGTPLAIPAARHL